MLLQQSIGRSIQLGFYEGYYSEASSSLLIVDELLHLLFSLTILSSPHYTNKGNLYQKCFIGVKYVFKDLEIGEIIMRNYNIALTIRNQLAFLWDIV